MISQVRLVNLGLGHSGDKRGEHSGDGDSVHVGQQMVFWLATVLVIMRDILLSKSCGS